MFCRALVLVSLAFSSFCMDAVAMANACNSPEDGICVESSNPDITVSCDEGVVVDSCSSEGRIGTCVFGDEATGVLVRFYQSFPGDAASECSTAGGQYRAG